jgi:hypothetical protein
VTRIRKLGALALATPLVMGLTILGTALPANAAGAGITSPSNGAVIKHGTTTRISASVDGGEWRLVVTPPGGADVIVASKNNLQSQTLSGSVSISRNGTYSVRLENNIVTWWNKGSRTFSVRVAPKAPGGLAAGVVGRKLTVQWNLGGEDDLTGYSVTAAGKSRSGGVGSFCSGTSCSTSFTLSSNTTGSVNVGVRALRSNGSGGTIVSGTSHTSVTVGGGTGGGATPNIPNANGGNTPLTPINPYSGLNLPTVAPDGSTPGFAYPTPTPEVATQNQIMGKTKPVAAVREMEWGQSLALALILLVCAAHLGTWTRRIRFAQAGSGSGGRLGRKGGGRARVKTAHERIARAEALAKTGTLTKADILGKAAAGPAQSPEVAGTRKAAAKRGKTTESGDLAVANDQIEEAVEAPAGLATKTEFRTPPVAAKPTIAQSASRSTMAVPPIQPLDRPATATATLSEMAEEGEDGSDAERPGTKADDRRTYRSPLRGRGRRNAE